MSPAGDESGRRTRAVLEVRDAAIPFGASPGLRELNLSVDEGEWVAIVGPSGVGKSTLLGAVAGEVTPSSGRVEIRGHRAGPGRVRRQEVVLLDQRPVLFPHLSVLDNVAFPLRVRGVDSDTRRTEALSTLEMVRLDALAERRPETLSGGQAHRVALARALVVKPALLLLDEPLAALDAQLRSALLPAMRTAIDAVGPAVLMVTHDLAEAGRLAHRVGILLDGRLAQLAPPADLFGAPASPEVAAFVGFTNRLEGRVDGDGRLPLPHPGVGSLATPFPSGTRACAVFGAHGLRIVPLGAPPSPTPPEAGSGAGDGPVFDARVVEVHPHPTGARIAVTLPRATGHSGVELPDEPVHWECEAGPELHLHPGDPVQVELVPERISLFATGDP